MKSWDSAELPQPWNKVNFSEIKLKKMDNVTKRTKSRLDKRARREKEDAVNISQVLGMSPIQEDGENLASATAL